MPVLGEPDATETLRWIAFKVAYEGSAFFGSQRQSHHVTVQGELERALERVLQEPVGVVLAGRTDAGVHATGQVARFGTRNQSLPLERVPHALNAVLARAVRVREARAVEPEFHPRFSATGRVYRYRIACGAVGNPMLQNLVGQVRQELVLSSMREAVGPLLGRQDFAAWQSAGSPVPTTVREVRRLEIREVEFFGSRLIEVEIEADAFLYQMVRNIVGALIEAGKGRICGADMQRLTAGRDRTKCPPPAPPQGLCLTQVNY